MRHVFLSPSWIDNFNAIHGARPDTNGSRATAKMDVTIYDMPAGGDLRLRYEVDFDVGHAAIVSNSTGRPDAHVHLHHGDAFPILALGDWSGAMAAMSTNRLRVQGHLMKVTGFAHLRETARFREAAEDILRVTVDAERLAPSALAKAQQTGPASRTTELSMDGVYSGDLPATMSHLLDQILGPRPMELGAQVYVALGQRVIADVGVGEARPGQAMTPDHKVYWGCVTKPAVTIGLLQQLELNRLDLDDPVHRYLPKFYGRGKEHITVRHLLLHTSGLDSSADEQFLLPLDELLDRIYRSGLTRGSKPGTIASYSIFSGFLVLGEVLRRLDGRSPADYVTAEVLQPLGLTSTLGMPAQTWRDNIEIMAPLFDNRWTPFREADYICNEYMGTAGLAANGIRGPMRDQALLFDALAKGGVNTCGRVLEPSSAEMMIRIHRQGMFDRNSIYAPNGAIIDTGLSVMRESQRYGPQSTTFSRRASAAAFGHDGATFASLAFVDPEYDLKVAVGANAIGDATPCRERIHTLTDAIYADLGLGGA